MHSKSKKLSGPWLWGRGAGVSWWGTEYADPCSGDECAGFWGPDYVALPVLTERGFDQAVGGGTRPAGAVICPPP